MISKARLKDFIVPKLKYGVSSVVATSVDYIVFFSLVASFGLTFTTIAQVCAYSCGLLTNFFLQKTFVFELKRKVTRTFQLAVSFSMLGLVISTSLIHFISKIDWALEYLFFVKVFITGIMFLYNFYTRRFAFEKKRLDDYKTRGQVQSSK